MASYYNEFDPKAAAWLRELISRGLIAPGDVDERSITEVTPDDLQGYTQCHFFAGIGVWSYALRRAGWSDDRHVWTGSCPCQPFSAAGKRGGFDDERHLWPTWAKLIDECRPPVVFGEQVASKDGLQWLDLVYAQMEASGYAVGSADLCAAGVGAPHIRQRLWFVAERLADTASKGCDERTGHSDRESSEQRRSGPSNSGVHIGLAHSEHAERRAVDSACDGVARKHPVPQREKGASGHTSSGEAGGLADSGYPRSPCAGDGAQPKSAQQQLGDRGAEGFTDRPAGPTNGLWQDVDWLGCRDGKWRPVEPGTFPLVDGAPARVGRLRGYGNAINAEVARAFIEAYLELK